MSGFPGLYAILDTGLLPEGRTAEDVVRAWLRAGVRLIQLRAKTMDGGPLLDLADRLAAEAAAQGATFIINDRVDIALLSGAAGVHLGQTDLPVADARRLMGADAVIGLSTHDTRQAATALTEPVSYIAVGPVFPTRSKANPDPVVGLDGVRSVAAAARAIGVPVVAIGGITLSSARAVIEAGASSVAVISDLMAGEIEERARAFLREIGAERAPGESEQGQRDRQG